MDHNSVTNKTKMTDTKLNLDSVNINVYVKFGDILPMCSQDIKWKQIRMSIKVTNLRKMTGNNPNQDLVNVNAYTNFVSFCPLFLKVLNGNEILTSIKGHNSVTNNSKMRGNNLNLDLVNMNECIKFGEIWSICSQDIERKLDSGGN